MYRLNPECCDAVKSNVPKAPRLFLVKSGMAWSKYVVAVDCAEALWKWRDVIRKECDCEDCTPDDFDELEPDSIELVSDASDLIAL